MRTSLKLRIAGVSAIALSLASFGVAHADTTTITNTGPNSTNVTTITNTTSWVVTNINTTTVTNANSQTGTSGSAQVNNNTSGGSAVSGNVTNTNSFGTAIAISNPGIPGSGSGSTPSNIAGGGSGSPSESTKVEARTLPKTGGDGIDTSLFNALYNAPKGVFAPLAKTGSNWSWALTALAASLAIASGFAYDRYKQMKLNKTELV